MIKGIGTDLVRTARIRASFERWGERFAIKILSPGELEEFGSVRNKVNYLAKRFAAKEAVAKALGTGMRSGVYFSSIEVKHYPSGAPYVVLHGHALSHANLMGVQSLHLSVSDEEGLAIAFAVLEGP
ncbi:MAG: holo-[acyl-carrier protein] synthase [Candidatus Azotimanducaceae bacterium]|jgi:holo-[acyl-carrier protein] synthase